MALDTRRLADLASHDAFIQRHNGPSQADVAGMLDQLGTDSIATLIEQTVPSAIRLGRELDLDPPRSEAEALDYLKRLARQNRVFKTYIGQGYHNTHLPAVIQRNVLENPGWYTAYTPYQPEIAQGRLEGLLNFQQVVMDLTGMELANASLLDEATAAAEAMALCKRANKKAKTQAFFVADDVLPQTLDVVRTRAHYFGFELITGPAEDLASHDVFGALLQYPGQSGEVRDLAPLLESASERGIMTCVAADIMSLVLLKEPGSLGADIVIGSSQRFGVPMASAARTPPSSPPPTSSSARSPVASSASPRTAVAIRPCAWRCRRVSSISAARRRPPTSVPPRHCWRILPASMPFIMAPRACAPSPDASTA